jgi:hypothetical protein
MNIEIPNQTEPSGTPNPELQTQFADRLVTLCDGRPGLRGGIHMDVRESSLAGPVPPPGDSLEIRDNSCNSCLDFISSDETLDRYDEIISASGWRLENYRRNPVFQNAHQYGDIIFTLGKALITEVRGGKLFQRIEFATEVNPMARIAYGLYKGKFLNAVSVGFIPLRWENGKSDGSDGSDGSRKACRRKYLEQELLEVSAVGIPANPNALQLGLKAGAIEKADLVELLEMLRAVCNSGADFSHSPAHPLTHSPDFCRSPAGSETDTSALGAGAYEAQLLQLARVLRQILRRA